MKKSKGAYLYLVGLTIALAFLVNGCCYCNTLRPLNKTQEMAAKQDYAGVAAINADCGETCDGCNKLHLLKGDACYRIAKNGQEPQKNYSCAAGELEKGIQLTKQWQVGSNNLNRSQTYINLCESLRNWRDKSSGAEADTINERLIKNAQGFLVAEPGDLCGVYFLNNAGYAKLLPRLLHPDQNLCGDLASMLRSVDEAAAKAGGTTCEQNLHQVNKEIVSARESAHCQ